MTTALVECFVIDVRYDDIDATSSLCDSEKRELGKDSTERSLPSGCFCLYRHRYIKQSRPSAAIGILALSGVKMKHPGISPFASANLGAVPAWALGQRQVLEEDVRNMRLRRCSENL
jgi:hypothetical protein